MMNFALSLPPLKRSRMFGFPWRKLDIGKVWHDCAEGRDIVCLGCGEEGVCKIETRRCKI